VDLTYRSFGTTGRDSQENSQCHLYVRSGQEGGSVPPEPGDLIRSELGSRAYITRYQKRQLVQSYPIFPMYRFTNFVSKLSNKQSYTCRVKL